MLMNIGANYLVLLSTIQKDWKDNNINLTKTVLQIIKHFKFIKGNKNTQNMMQTFNPSIHWALK